MKQIKQLITAILITSLLSCCKNIEKKVVQQHSNEWVKLFNGKDLNDWTIKIKGQPAGVNYKNTFRVENGILKVNYDEYNDIFDSSFGHIFYNKEFSNYRFRMEYRFTGNQIKDGAGWAKRNSGIMIHGQTPESMLLDQDFPISIEVQLLGGLGNGNRPTGNLCTPGTNVEMDGKLFTSHCINSSSKTYDGDQWVKVEILVMNDSIISHFINNEQVLTYNKPQIGGKNVLIPNELLEPQQGIALKKGTISLQSESHPVEFKNIEILELK